ncbi:amidase [Phyllosticta citrichinensis]|uniref:amidase n=1 Tax=Phyllosticta citrichinensis TaxID=1130410 RepID=A0ABR1Y8E4_9PEZI
MTTTATATKTNGAKPSWEEAARVKREAIFASLPREYLIPEPLPSPEEQRDVTGAYAHQFLTQREIEITETDAAGIVAKTTTGEWSAVDVTKAFIHRACMAHQLLNCLHETDFPSALATAASLDAHFAEHKKPIGPLHGLPVSLKDQCHMKGLDTTMGYVGWIGTHEGDPSSPLYRNLESVIVTELRRQGTVLYCKTAVPATLMAGETVNHIVGWVRNPKNRLVSCGGSSGGEGALVGFKGSPGSFGTDIGGSVRIPSAFNGLYGLRPSNGRLPYEGMANSMDGQNTILSVVGPIAGTLASTRLLAKAVVDSEPWWEDPLVHEIPWREEQADAVRRQGKLVFGVLRDDGMVRLTPPMRRGLEAALEAVKKAGHEVVEWEPPAECAHKHLLEIATQTWSMDGGDDVIKAFGLSGEPPMPHLLLDVPATPHPELPASAIAALNVRKRRIQKAYMDFWSSTAKTTATGRPVDALLTAPCPHPASIENQFPYTMYTTFANVLDYTAVIVPTGVVVDPALDAREGGMQWRSELEQRIHEKAFDPEIQKGAPVAVQIVGRRLQEERVLAISEIVDEALKKAS